MSTSVSLNREEIDRLLSSYETSKAGQRGIDSYLWFVRLLHSSAAAHTVAIFGDKAAGLVTVVSKSAVLHCLQGDLEWGAEVISAAREYSATSTFRGLALPGDRLTKNLFEEARLPAQMLMH